MDPGMNNLLNWSLQNSANAPNGQQDPSTTESSNALDPRSTELSERAVNQDALRALMGGPSESEMMVSSMSAIRSPDVSLDDKLIAFDNFEQLIESIDNANNMESLGLWTPLIATLKDSQESELRRYAAWCIGSAVQNNVKAQEKLLVFESALPTLLKLAVEDESEGVRRKAIYAVSSAIRNYQPALDEAVKVLPKDFAPEGGIDAMDMDAVDRVINRLREGSTRQAT